MEGPFSENFSFQNKVQKKLVSVTDPLYHSERINNPSNFGIINYSKTNKIQFVTIYYNNITKD